MFGNDPFKGKGGRMINSLESLVKEKILSNEIFWWRLILNTVRREICTPAPSDTSVIVGILLQKVSTCLKDLSCRRIPCYLRYYPGKVFQYFPVIFHLCRFTYLYERRYSLKPDTFFSFLLSQFIIKNHVLGKEQKTPDINFLPLVQELSVENLQSIICSEMWITN